MVELKRAGAGVQVSVIDTGIGIRAADQANLFNRFFRANDQVVKKVGGTGLGLSISKGLTELHGGSLTFKSQYRAGTTFTITLPIAGPEPDENVETFQPSNLKTYS
jgi:signal transduction histidine kinase